MVFIGVGGSIDGQVNPVLSAAESQVVQVTLINGEGAEHDIVFDNQGPAGNSAHIVGKGASTSIAFAPAKAGDYVYFCSVPGHRLSGMIRVLALIVALFCVAPALAQPLPANLDKANAIVIDTNKGRIVIALRADLAPGHAGNKKAPDLCRRGFG